MTIRGVTILSVVAGIVFSAGCEKRSLERDLSGAAATGNVEQIKRLVKMGVNVNCRDNTLNGWTPLIWALWEEQYTAAEVLLAAGADPNLRDKSRKAPLFYTLGSGDRSAVIKALIAAGARTEDYRESFETLAPDDPNRLAFEGALSLRSSGRVQSGTNRLAP